MITTKAGRLILECDACRKPVTGETGWLHVDMGEVGRVERAAAEWKKQHPGPFIVASAYLDYPEAAPWKVHHKTCDPDGDDHNCYWFHAGRCNTWPKLVSWTAHLMGKNWLGDTNWQELLEHLTAEVCP